MLRMSFSFEFVVLLFVSILSCGYAFSVTFLHTNDIHSRLEETSGSGLLCTRKLKMTNKCFGGMARISTKAKEIRKLEKNVLLFDGGDQQTGSLWYDVWLGNATALMMNALGYDAMVLGNHDFDGGVDHTVRYLNMINATVVMSNLETEKETLWPKQQKLFETSLILTVGSNKIGICGYILKSTPRVSNTGPYLRFNDEVSSVRDCANQLKVQGINKIVALGHSGIEVDERIAKEVEEIDIVVGGHSNTFLYTGSPPSKEIPLGPYPLVVGKGKGKTALVVQDFAFGKYLGYLNVTFDEKGDVINWHGNPILLDHSVAKDANIMTKLESMKGAVDKVAKVEVGKTRVFLDGDKRSCYLGECALGNLVTDAAVYNSALRNANESRWTTASIALWTSNSIVASIDVNTTEAILYEDIKNSFPYMNKLDTVDVSGSVLLQILEKSVSDYSKKKPSGSFLQVSGLIITYDLSKPVNQRVAHVEVRCADCRVPKYENLAKNKVYKVIVSSYMAQGGAGYDILLSKRLSHTPGITKDTDAIVEYIKARTPLIIETGNRLRFIRKPEKLNSRSTKCATVKLWYLNVFVIFIMTTLFSCIDD